MKKVALKFGGLKKWLYLYIVIERQTNSIVKITIMKTVIKFLGICVFPAVIVSMLVSLVLVVCQNTDYVLTCLLSK